MMVRVEGAEGSPSVASLGQVRRWERRVELTRARTLRLYVVGGSTGHRLQERPASRADAVWSVH